MNVAQSQTQISTSRPARCRARSRSWRRRLPSNSSKNHFQSIHAELHRRYKAKSYSLIRVEQYAAVLKFLEEWDEAMESGA